MGNEASQQTKRGESIENNIRVTWTKEHKETPFVPRDGHCAAAIGSDLFIFGGVLAEAGNCYESNELITYNAESSVWRKIESKGVNVPPRVAATMAAVDSSLYVFGGLSQESGWFDDMYKFDTETSVWTCIQAEGTGPSPRDKLASATVGKHIYFFGGFGPQQQELESEEDEDESDDQQETPADQEGAQFGWFDDLFVFDTENNTWSNPIQLNLQKPTPRAAHAMCSVGSHLFVFGGRDSEGRKNDTHIFDTVSRKWQNITISGQQPEPRSYHTATTVGQRVVILGGRGLQDQHFADFNIFDVDTMQWLQPAVEGTPPPARGVHTATLVGDQLVVFGGSSDFDSSIMQCNMYYNDIHTVPAKEIQSGTPIPKVEVAAHSRSEGDREMAAVPAKDRSSPKEGSPKPGPPSEQESVGDGVSPAKKRKTETDAS